MDTDDLECVNCCTFNKVDNIKNYPEVDNKDLCRCTRCIDCLRACVLVSGGVCQSCLRLTLRLACEQSINCSRCNRARYLQDARRSRRTGLWVCTKKRICKQVENENKAVYFKPAKR